MFLGIGTEIWNIRQQTVQTDSLESRNQMKIMPAILRFYPHLKTIVLSTLIAIGFVFQVETVQAQTIQDTLWYNIDLASIQPTDWPFQNWWGFEQQFDLGQEVISVNDVLIPEIPTANSIWIYYPGSPIADVEITNIPYPTPVARAGVGVVITITNISKLAPRFEPVAKIGPNPTQNRLGIQLEDASEGSHQISMMNLAGQTVLLKNEEHLSGDFISHVDVSHLPNGIYVLFVRHQQYQVKKRIEVLH